ncbi:MAG: RagB/SusD family nutrient uptake outer membrane protein [Bacteroidia bacterium]|nr:RagB/SusD family nutrient uptake outer membrane protein [Bacteroidia bacterium]
MKNILLTLSLATALMLGGCFNEFLEVKPLGQLTSDNFFQTEEHAVWATNAAYEQLRSWDVHVFSYLGLTDILSDDADKGSTPSDATFLLELDNFTFDPGNLAIATVWKGYYRGIFRANIAIQKIPAIEMDEALKARLIAECQFLRAYYYLNLVRWFGDLPLVTEPLPQEEYKQNRVPAAAIYAQIIQDLEAAAAVLPERSAYAGADAGRATRGAALGMLARAYLTQGNMALALQYAEAVINSGEYALLPDYAGIFLPEGENSEESLFEIQAAAFETGGGGTQYNEVQGVRGTPNLGWGFNRPSDDLLQSYEPGDPRREATILYVGEVLPDGSAIVQDNPGIFGERYNQKAWIPTGAGGNGNGGGNIRVLRYADILLIAAEALNELGRSAEALPYLNAVRARARAGSIFVLKDVTTTDQATLRTLIWRERRAELAMEQGRWFDLQRQGRAGTVMQALGKNFVTGKHELLPLPQSEIDISGTLTQNPGY